jgi:hypothetical protein
VLLVLRLMLNAAASLKITGAAPLSVPEAPCPRGGKEGCP